MEKTALDEYGGCAVILRVEIREKLAAFECNCNAVTFAPAEEKKESVNASIPFGVGSREIKCGLKGRPTVKSF